MTTAIDETWTAVEARVLTTDDEADEGNFATFTANHCHTTEQADRARLAAAAPAMARLLVGLLDGQEQDEGYYRCVVCDSTSPRTGEHLPDCPLVSVLRDAGVIE